METKGLRVDRVQPLALYTCLQLAEVPSICAVSRPDLHQWKQDCTRGGYGIAYPMKSQSRHISYTQNRACQYVQVRNYANPTLIAE